MTEDDKILNSLLLNPNEMLSVGTESYNNAPHQTTKRTNPMQRKVGSIYSLNPSDKAMQPPINANSMSASFSIER